MSFFYQSRPFQNSGEHHFESNTQSTRSDSSTTQCSCQQGIARCNQCRQSKREEKSTFGQSSHTMLPSIKEETDPSQRHLTAKARRDQRRAAGRGSVRAAFEEAVSSEDYFTFYHSTAFSRSPTASSRSLYRRSSSRKSSAEQAGTPQVPTLETADSTDSTDSADSIESVESGVGGEQDVSRRGS